MTEKKPPVGNVVDEVQGDLRKVGGFFKSLWKATERVQNGVEAAKEEPREKETPPKRIAHEVGCAHLGYQGTCTVCKAERARTRQAQVIDMPEGCGVCGGTRLVGDRMKVPCPACTTKKP